MRTLVLLVCFVSGMLAQGLAPALQQRIEEIVRQEMEQQKIPGVSIAVAANGKLQWSAGFGMADVENRVPVKAETMFRLGSISKPIAAVTAMQAWEDGKLDLDAPVQQYVPAFPKKPWPVTARQLLAHLGGIRHYAGRDEVDSTRHYTDLLSPLRIFQDDPLVAEPGTRFNYTTYGYVLLGAAVEATTGARFTDYLRSRVFGPAGMETARDDHTHDIIPNRARGYAFTPSGALRNANLADTSNKIPGGGLISTAADLVRFALAVRGNTLLKRATVDTMLTPQKLRDGSMSRYGLGWYVEPLGGRKAAYHGGAQQGVRTFLILLPREGVAVGMMCNLEGGNVSGPGQRIALLLAERQ